MRTFSNEEFRTFKVRYTGDQIVTAHRTELLLTPQSTHTDPKLVYYPFDLMEVKYTDRVKNKTAENLLLWGLCDGEMVTDVANWEKTRGFEECLVADLKSEEFAVIAALHTLQGSVTRDQLNKKCKEDSIDLCIKKKLIAEEDGCLRLHFANPNLQLVPKTNCTEPLVTLLKSPDNIAQKRYTQASVEKFVQAAFGAHFAIKTSKQIFLPVYEIAVQNPDGTVLKTYWNALNGKRMDALLREI